MILNKKKKSLLNIGLLVAIFFSLLSLSYAVTPNPGHPWSGVGDGNFAVTGQTTPRTFTLPDADATVLTNGSAVTVAQGGTAAASLTGILVGNGASTFGVTTSPDGLLVGDSASQTLTNKTLVASSNYITSTGAILGDLFKFDGTRFERFAIGAPLNYLRTNGAGTDLEWASLTNGPAGSDGQIQFNSGGSSWGATSSLSISNGVLYLDNTLTLSTTTLPSVATTGTIKMFNRQLAGRDFLKFRSDVTEDYSTLQPNLFQNNICLVWVVSGGALASFGCAVNVGVLSNGVSQVDGYTLRSTFGSSGLGVYTSSDFLRGTTSVGRNGFFAFIRSTLPDANYANSSGVRLTYGLSDQTSGAGCASDNVSNQDMIAFNYSTALSANWRVAADDGSASAPDYVDTGMPFTASTTYDFYIYSPPYPSTSTIYWRLDNLTTGTTTVEGISTSRLPAASTFLNLQSCADSVNSVTRNWRLDTMYVEVPR